MKHPIPKCNNLLSKLECHTATGNGATDNKDLIFLSVFFRRQTAGLQNSLDIRSRHLEHQEPEEISEALLRPLDQVQPVPVGLQGALEHLSEGCRVFRTNFVDAKPVLWISALLRIQ